ncbi:MAG TPA: DNA cytosine methyltransferase [Tenuifilaceae bacterium]|nr:DNA cytosine methyltransferase [Tenuifilaceae bacterium]HPE17500.1 DNA cytosine methyltransferase [Tenuifilaceae bacterium]HPJ45129.1 DNA cytosine methyltransferase [Tenuifilaceae bacterium]HPQ33729.1 DNA cytosine methyltransferase [Tenuifilaceae bacterium]HRX68050.1 DNA cytosine methyltransferase [Tenuifilaceae bacterium]
MKSAQKKSFRFIDLFAGIGGFHVAMGQLGGECVFASEIDKFAIETYRQNFNIDAENDITKVEESNIPKHDVLCAGFPCQAFSKAGKQNGFDDTRGTLFFDIQRILKYHRPKYILLENVRNLVSHDGGRTWQVIHKTLCDLGYLIPDKPIIISPHQIGVPQLRERVLIPGVLKNSIKVHELNFDIPSAKRNQTSSLNILNGTTSTEYQITEYEDYVLSAWNEFLIGLNQKILGFPVWASEFGKNEKISNLPRWKQEIVEKNRNLYKSNKKHIDSWLRKYNNLNDFVKTHRKFEWQAGEDIKSVWEGIIQFRPSGIRVKRPTEFPALVAMVHVPIIGWQKRRITPREAANLQSFPNDFIINPNKQQAFKQFGNSVNVSVVKFIAGQLFSI